MCFCWMCNTTQCKLMKNTHTVLQGQMQGHHQHNNLLRNKYLLKIHFDFIQVFEGFFPTCFHNSPFVDALGKNCLLIDYITILHCIILILLLYNNTTLLLSYYMLYQGILFHFQHIFNSIALLMYNAWILHILHIYMYY